MLLPSQPVPNGTVLSWPAVHETRARGRWAQPAAVAVGTCTAMPCHGLLSMKTKGQASAASCTLPPCTCTAHSHGLAEWPLQAEQAVFSRSPSCVLPPSALHLSYSTLPAVNMPTAGRRGGQSGVLPLCLHPALSRPCHQSLLQAEEAVKAQRFPFTVPSFTCLNAPSYTTVG